MDIKRADSQASTEGPPEWFTGTVRIDPLVQAAIQEKLDGKVVEWMEHITYEDHRI